MRRDGRFTSNNMGFSFGWEKSNDAKHGIFIRASRHFLLTLVGPDHNGFLRGGMFFPEHAGYVAKRHFMALRRHFPERPFPMSGNHCGVYQYALLPPHRLLRRVRRMAGHLEYSGLTAQR